MLTIKYETTFKKDFKRVVKRGYNIKLMEKVIELCEKAVKRQGKKVSIDLLQCYTLDFFQKAFELQILLPQEIFNTEENIQKYNDALWEDIEVDLLQRQIEGYNMPTSSSEREKYITNIRNLKAEIEENMELVFRLFPRLLERKKQLAGTLSGGEQQMLAIGRALLSNPEMIVLDEPSMGLSPLLVTEVFEIIKTLQNEGKTVLLVEQNAKKAMSIADRVYVLESGMLTMEGPASELINNENIKKAYLGE